MTSMFSELELERLTSVIDPLRRARLTLARGALRAILGRYLDIEAHRVPLTRDRRGKPQLDGIRNLAFSLSHSRLTAAVAVTRRQTVGLDIQEAGRAIPRSLYERSMSPKESAQALALATETEREKAFLRHWTVREACGKAHGVGLASRDCAHFSLQRFDPRPGIFGAVAVSGGSWRAVALKLAPSYLG
jgi:4'-phosphopantetheinyl transferase